MEIFEYKGVEYVKYEDACKHFEKNHEIISKIIIFVQHNLTCNKMEKIQRFISGLDLDEKKKDKDQLEFKNEQV